MLQNQVLRAHLLIPLGNQLMHRNNLWVKHTSLQRKLGLLNLVLFCTSRKSLINLQHTWNGGNQSTSVWEKTLLSPHTLYTVSYHSHHPKKTRTEDIWREEGEVRGTRQSKQLWEQSQAWLWRNIRKSSIWTMEMTFATFWPCPMFWEFYIKFPCPFQCFEGFPISFCCFLSFQTLYFIVFNSFEFFHNRDLCGEKGSTFIVLCVDIHFFQQHILDNPCF